MDSVIFWIRLIGVTVLAMLLTADLVHGLRHGQARMYSMPVAKKDERPGTYWAYFGVTALLGILCWAAALHSLTTALER